MPKLEGVPCPYPIPEPYCWDESFKVFYENLDDEHRQLFVAVFNLQKDTNATNLQKLLDVTVNHFNDEEGMMQKAQYVNFPDHKKMHDDFVSKLKSLKAADCDKGVFEFAKSWLVEHIKTTDFKYKTKL